MTALDAGAILRTLAAHQVRFLLIGGMAGVFHGSTTITQDLDICYAVDRADFERLASALLELGVRPRGMDPELPFRADAQTLRNGANFTFDSHAGPLDCLAEASGGFTYEKLLPASTIYPFEGLDVPVVSLDDLIRMKRAAGRNKDLIEVENLSALREVRDGKKDRDGKKKRKT